MSKINGTPFLTGIVTPGGNTSPVVGPRKCRITRPLRVVPDHSGYFGRAWLVNLRVARRKLPPGAVPDAMVAHWVVEAPWSSEVVHSYSILLTHLRPDLFHAPVVYYLAGATHEVALNAIHPGADREVMLSAPTDMNNWLRPSVFASQIIEQSDEAAISRVGHVVDLICAGRLSPHPTHVQSWIRLFGDNMMRVAQGPAPEKEGEADQ